MNETRGSKIWRAHAAFVATISWLFVFVVVGLAGAYLIEDIIGVSRSTRPFTLLLIALPISLYAAYRMYRLTMSVS